MGSVNKVILLGNLGHSPSMKTLPSGQITASFSLSTSESWTKDGQKNEKTEWHKVVCYGKLAEVAQKYLAKGLRVYVEGKLQTRSWDGADGKKSYATEVIATDLTLLDRAAPPSVAPHADAPQESPPTRAFVADADVPF